MRLTLKPDQIHPLRLMLRDEIARVEGMPESDRIESDRKSLAAARDLLRKLDSVRRRPQNND